MGHSVRTLVRLASLALMMSRHLVAAGEIQLHVSSNCATGFVDDYVVLAASESYDCLSVVNGGSYAAMQSSRVIRPSCVIQGYSDTGCKNLVHSVSTTAGSGKCLAGSYRGFRITCNPSVNVPRGAVGSSPPNQRAALPDLKSLRSSASTKLSRRGPNDYLVPGNIFYEPPTTWAGMEGGGLGVRINSTSYSGGGGGPNPDNIANDAATLVEQFLARAENSQASSVGAAYRGVDNYYYTIRIISYSDGEARAVAGVMGPAVVVSVVAEALQGLSVTGNGNAFFSVSDTHSTVFGVFQITYGPNPP